VASDICEASRLLLCPRLSTITFQRLVARS
jgi:hypothetical protein